MVHTGCNCASHHWLKPEKLCPYTKVMYQDRSTWTDYGTLEEALNISKPEEDKVTIKPEDAEAAVKAGTHRWVEKETDEPYTEGEIIKSIGTALDEDSADIRQNFVLAPAYTDPEFRYGDIIRPLKDSLNSPWLGISSFGRGVWQYLPASGNDEQPFMEVIDSQFPVANVVYYGRSALPEKVWVSQRLSDCTPPGPKDSNNRPCF